MTQAKTAKSRRFIDTQKGGLRLNQQLSISAMLRGLSTRFKSFVNSLLGKQNERKAQQSILMRQQKEKPQVSQVEVAENFGETLRDKMIKDATAALEAKKPKESEVTTPDDTLDLDMVDLVMVEMTPFVKSVIEAEKVVAAQITQLQIDAQRLQLNSESAGRKYAMASRNAMLQAALQNKLKAIVDARVEFEYRQTLSSGQIGAGIINDAIDTSNTNRQTNLEQQAAFLQSLINLTDPVNDQEVKVTQINIDIFALIEALFVSRGDVADLLKSLSNKRQEVDALIDSLKDLTDEGLVLAGFKSTKLELMTDCLMQIELINRQLTSLKPQLDTLNELVRTFSFTLTSDYDALVDQKNSIDANIKILREGITETSGLLNQFDLAADMKRISDAKEIKATEMASITAALTSALSGKDGALATQATLFEKYTAAKEATFGPGSTSDTLSKTVAGPPSMGELGNNFEAVVTPEQTNLADIAQSDLLKQTPVFNSAVKMATDLQSQITQQQADLAANTQQRDSAFNVLNGPNGLFVQRGKLQDAIDKLKGLRTMTTDANTNMTDLESATNILKGLLVLPNDSDVISTEALLQAANSALATLNSQIKGLERERKLAAQNIAMLTSELAADTATLQGLQSQIDMAAAKDLKNALTDITPTKPSMAAVTDIDSAKQSLNGKMEALVDNVSAVIRESAVLRAAVSNEGLSQSVDTFEAKVEIATNIVSIVDAAAKTSTEAAITSATTTLSTSSAKLATLDSAVTDANTAMVTAQATLNPAVATVTGLQTTVLPSQVSNKSLLLNSSGGLFSTLVNQRLFPQSLSNFGRSFSDLARYYAGKSIATMKPDDTAKTDATKADAKGKVELILNMKDTMGGIKSQIDSLKNKLKGTGLTDTSIYSILLNLNASQTVEIASLLKYSGDIKKLATSTTTSDLTLSLSKDQIIDLLTKLQKNFVNVKGLGELKSSLMDSVKERNNKKQLDDLAKASQQSSQEMDAAHTARVLAETPKVVVKPSTGKVKSIETSMNALDPNVKSTVLKMLTLYGQMKNDTSALTGKQELQNFLNEIGTSYTKMADANRVLVRALNKILMDSAISDNSRRRVAHLLGLLDALNGIDGNTMRTISDIAKLIGERDGFLKSAAIALQNKGLAVKAADPKPNQKANIQQDQENIQDIIDAKTELLDKHGLTNKDRAKIEAEIELLQERLIVQNNDRLHADLNAAKNRLSLVELRKKIIIDLMNNKKFSLNKELLTKMMMELNRLNSEMEAINRNIASINAQISSTMNTIKTVNDERSILEKLREALSKLLPARGNIPISITTLLAAAGISISILGALGFILPFLGAPGGLDSIDCNLGKVSAAAAAASNSISVALKGGKAGLAYAKQNKTAASAANVMEMPAGVTEASEAVDATQGLGEGEGEGEVIGEGEPIGEGEAANEEEMQGGGDDGDEADIPQAKEAEDGEEEEYTNDNNKKQEEGQNAQEENEEQGTSLAENLDGLQIYDPSKMGESDALSSDAMAIPSTIIDPIVQQWTVGKSPSFIRCFIDELTKLLGKVWESTFKAAYNAYEPPMEITAPYVDTAPAEGEEEKDEDEDEDDVKGTDVKANDEKSIDKKDEESGADAAQQAAEAPEEDSTMDGGGKWYH